MTEIENKLAKYLVRLGTIKSLYKIEKETNCFYLVKINDNCTERVSKKTMRTGKSWYSVYWKVATEEDLEYFQRKKLIYNIKKIVGVMDFKSFTTNELIELRKMLEKKKIGE